MASCRYCNHLYQHHCNNISATKIHVSRSKGTEAHDGREYEVLPQIANNWFSETRFAQDKKILDLVNGPYVSISSMFYFEMCRSGHSAHGSPKKGNDHSRCLGERWFHRMWQMGKPGSQCQQLTSIQIGVGIQIQLIRAGLALSGSMTWSK